MQRKNRFFYPFFFGKVFVMLFAGVYCFSPLGLYVVYGVRDVLLPFEAVVGVCVGVCLFVWSGVEVLRCLRRP